MVEQSTHHPKIEDSIRKHLFKQKNKLISEDYVFKNLQLQLFSPLLLFIDN
jgi:hypothetical protein